MTHWKRAALALLALSIPSVGSAELAAPPAAARLTALGFLSEASDMALAVRNFQVANGIAETGELDAGTILALGSADARGKIDYLQSLAELYAGDPIASGAVGDPVRTLQTALSELGYYAGSADGAFGEATRSAVMAFQTANGLYASGEADAAVRARLYGGAPLSWVDFIAGKLCKKGDSGRSVRSLQRRLRLLGFFDGEATASFGERTQRALELFQRENALPESGHADDATCRMLYGGAARSRTEDGLLSEGDSGEDVRALQAELNRLGYFSEGLSGSFGESTLVAVAFFQIANGLSPTGSADANLLAAMRAASAVPFFEAEETLNASGANAGPEVLAAAAATAEGMLGIAFPQGDDALFPGFRFAQYVFARSGVAITDPGRIVGEAADRLLDADAPAAGEVIALERADDAGVRMLFSVYIGGGRIAYHNADTGFVVSGDLSQMEFSSAYVWNLGSG